MQSRLSDHMNSSPLVANISNNNIPVGDSVNVLRAIFVLDDVSSIKDEESKDVLSRLNDIAVNAAYT